MSTAARPAPDYERVTNVRHRLVVARQLARQLRAEKSDHDWTNRECDLLGELCEVLGVEKQDA